MKNIFFVLILILKGSFAISAAELKESSCTREDDDFDASGPCIISSVDLSSKERSPTEEEPTQYSQRTDFIDFINDDLFVQCASFLVCLDDNRVYDYSSCFLLPSEFYVIRLLCTKSFNLCEEIIKRFLLLPDEKNYLKDEDKRKNRSVIRTLKLYPDLRVRSLTPQDKRGQEILNKQDKGIVTFFIKFQGFARRGSSPSFQSIVDSTETSWPVQKNTFFRLRRYDPLIIIIGNFLRHINMSPFFQPSSDEEKTLYDQTEGEIRKLIKNKKTITTPVKFYFTEYFEENLEKSIRDQLEILKNKDQKQYLKYKSLEEKSFSSFWTLGVNQTNNSLTSPWIFASLECQEDEIFIVLQDHRERTNHPYPVDNNCSFVMGYHYSKGVASRGMPPLDELLTIGEPLRPRWLFKLKIQSSIDCIKKYIKKITENEPKEKQLRIKKIKDGNWGEKTQVNLKNGKSILLPIGMTFILQN
tara:strand:- start:492 stop:1904 length:1413 start_codon:yes stop_codon:yes gene_type:complete